MASGNVNRTPFFGSFGRPRAQQGTVPGSSSQATQANQGTQTSDEVQAPGQAPSNTLSAGLMATLNSLRPVASQRQAAHASEAAAQAHIEQQAHAYLATLKQLEGELTDPIWAEVSGEVSGSWNIGTGITLWEGKFLLTAQDEAGFSLGAFALDDKKADVLDRIKTLQRGGQAPSRAQLQTKIGTLRVAVEAKKAAEALRQKRIGQAKDFMKILGDVQAAYGDVLSQTSKYSLSLRVGHGDSDILVQGGKFELYDYPDKRFAVTDTSDKAVALAVKILNGANPTTAAKRVVDALAEKY